MLFFKGFLIFIGLLGHILVMDLYKGDINSALTLKAPITTAADDKFCDIFRVFNKNNVWYFMRIVCQQTILMKYHALFVIFEKAAKFEIGVCCKL